MSPTSLPLPRALVALGFLFTGGGELFWIRFTPWDHTIEFIDLSVLFTAGGFLVLGWASSALLRALGRRSDHPPGLRRALRLFAVGWFLSGVNLVWIIGLLIDLYRNPFHFGVLHQAISDFLQLLGFGLASLGFFVAASMLKPRVSPENEAPAQPVGAASLRP